MPIIKQLIMTDKTFEKDLVVAVEKRPSNDSQNPDLTCSPHLIIDNPPSSEMQTSKTDSAPIEIDDRECLSGFC